MVMRMVLDGNGDAHAKQNIDLYLQPGQASL